MKVLVSACLLGDNCKYNGGNNKSTKLQNYIKEHPEYTFLKFCPECLCGLPIPREPVEYVNGELVNKLGHIYHDELNKGKCEISKILDENNDIILAITKSKSPSCGVNGIYDGTFTKTLINKDGFAIELIKSRNIKAITEDDL